MSRTVTSQEWDITSNSIKARDEDKEKNNAKVIALIEAVNKKDKSGIDTLLQEGAPINLSLGGDVTPLVAAIENEDLDMVLFLLSRGASVSHKLTNGIDAPWVAMEKGLDEIFITLFNTGEVSSKTRTKDNSETRLMGATKCSNLMVVKMLINNGKASLSAYDAKGRTALHHNLLKKPYTEIDGQIGSYLLEQKSNPNQQDNEGLTAAAFADSPEQMAILEGIEVAPITPEMVEKVRLIKNPPVVVVDDKIDFTGVTAPRISKALPKPMLPQKLGRRKGK